MTPRRSLFVKVLFWFFLNIGILGLALVLLFNFRVGLETESWLGGLFGGGFPTVSRLVSLELNMQPREDWPDILARYSDGYGVDLHLALIEGGEQTGLSGQLPPQVREEIQKIIKRDLPPPSPRFPPRHPPQSGPQHPPPPPRQGPRKGLPPPPSFWTHTANPSRYWMGIHIHLVSERRHLPRSAVLVAASDSITGRGLFFNPWPWVVIATTVIVISVLLWLPLVRSLTRPISRMKKATEQIAQGRFDIRLDEKRRDEIGQLAKAVNEMAAKLDGLVRGQKRFLGDVAHELASPIARMQLGLSILERKIDDKDKPGLQDVVEEVEHMSNLVNELLSFTRAEMNPAKVKLRNVALKPIAQRVIQRESPDPIDVRVLMDKNLEVYADPDLMTRALANLLRNAARYAGQAGPIEITGRKQGDEVIVEVLDSGPGVPPDVLGQLFEPFFRPESARGRETGGVGLGLSIVKTCIQTCQGSVSCRNLDPKGFAVTMVLKAS